jgi:glucokinase
LKDPILIGVDIGGTKIETAVVRNETLLGQATGPTACSSPDRFLDAVLLVIDKALDKAGTGRNQVSALGIGAPGMVDPLKGVINLAVNLNLDSYPLVQELKAHFDAPAAIENDVRTATLGAYRLVGQEMPVRSMAYLNIGTGIAAGLILDGELYRGPHGMAGEIGHAIIVPGGPRCSCGASGCLESVAAGPAIAREGEQKLPLLPKPVSTRDVYQAAQEGNRSAQEIVQDVSRTLGRAIQWLVMSYDVEQVVLGGGVTRSGPAFIDPIHTELVRLQNRSPLVERMLNRVVISLLPDDYNAGVWGALMLARSLAKDGGTITQVSDLPVL